MLVTAVAVAVAVSAWMLGWLILDSRSSAGEPVGGARGDSSLRLSEESQPPSLLGIDAAQPGATPEASASRSPPDRVVEIPCLLVLPASVRDELTIEVEVTDPVDGRVLGTARSAAPGRLSVRVQLPASTGVAHRVTVHAVCASAQLASGFVAVRVPPDRKVASPALLRLDAAALVRATLQRVADANGPIEVVFRELPDPGETKRVHAWQVHLTVPTVRRSLVANGGAVEFFARPGPVELRARAIPGVFGEPVRGTAVVGRQADLGVLVPGASRGDSAEIVLSDEAGKPLPGALVCFGDASVALSFASPGISALRGLVARADEAGVVRLDHLPPTVFPLAFACGTETHSVESHELLGPGVRRVVLSRRPAAVVSLTGSARSTQELALGRFKIAPVPLDDEQDMSQSTLATRLRAYLEGEFSVGSQDRVRRGLGPHPVVLARTGAYRFYAHVRGALVASSDVVRIDDAVRPKPVALDIAEGRWVGLTAVVDGPTEVAAASARIRILPIHDERHARGVAELSWDLLSGRSSRRFWLPWGVRTVSVATRSLALKLSGEPSRAIPAGDAPHIELRFQRLQPISQLKVQATLHGRPVTVAGLRVLAHPSAGWRSDFKGGVRALVEFEPVTALTTDKGEAVLAVPAGEYVLSIEQNTLGPRALQTVTAEAGRVTHVGLPVVKLD